MSSIVVVVACILIGVCYFIVRSRTEAKPKAVSPREDETLQCEDYYDGEKMGVREVASGKLHVFPLSLVQQIDAGSDTANEPRHITFYVTAEFNYAEFQFSETAAESFLSVIEGALPAFDMAEAKAKVANTFSTGEGATLYVSPNYPDAGIFPKFRATR